MKMKKTATTGELIFKVFNSLIMVFLILVTLYPIWYVAVASLSQPDLVMQHRGLLFLPLGKLSLKAYYSVLVKDPMVLISYKNTLFYVLAGTFISVILTSLGAYGLSRKNVKLANPLMFLITFTMLFNGGLIPLYLLVGNLNMTNTRWAVIIPNAISVYNLIILRTSFKSIPESLEESAKIDGANHFTIFTKIVLPLSKAVLAVIILFYSVAIWNAWFWSMVFLRDRELYPLQLILREILITNSMDSMTIGVSSADTESVGITIQYATIIVSTLPILLVYPFAQKYFVKGVMIGAIKG